MSSAWGKRMSSAWGKRMSSAWGKRSDIDDDYSNHLLRELFYRAHLNKYEYPRYPVDNDGKSNETFLFFCFLLIYICLGFEQYLVQRTISNNDDESASQNSS